MSTDTAARTGKVVEINHPLVKHKVTLLRDKTTETKDFRQLANELAMFVCYEATKQLETHEVNVETPLEETTGQKVSGKKVAVVPILRAGLGMLDGVIEFMPVARIGFIGLYRDEETHQPHTYYNKLPDDMDQRTALVLDPMLATGGSVNVAIEQIKQSGATDISMLALIAAPEGIKALQDAHPDVNIFVAQIDRQLNENAYICPGLGDAGDRLFGTK